MKVQGVGGMSKILGIIPKCNIRFGEIQILHSFAVVEMGAFDLLLGNDFLKRINIQINPAQRSCYYDHPIYGRKTMTFEMQKNSKP